MAADGNGAPASKLEHLRRALRGDPAALPVGEALHPVALAAVALLVVNDWVLKPRLGASVVTGKLSDLAGLAFAPVALTALVGLVLAGAARLGARVRPWLTHRRLVLAVAATGAAFAAIKLDAGAAALFVRATELFGRPAAVALDRTDLLCLPALAVAYAIGRDELRRLAREARGQ